MLPPDRRASEDPGELLDRIDALVLGGGADIDPESQGVEAPPGDDRDATPTATASRSPSRWGRSSAASRCSASAAACRSSTSPAAGRSTSTSPTGSGTSIHRPVPGSWAEHEVRIEPGSLAAEAAGTERLTVKSHHHQGVDRIADEAHRHRLGHRRRERRGDRVRPTAASRWACSGIRRRTRRTRSSRRSSRAPAGSAAAFRPGRRIRTSPGAFSSSQATSSELKPSCRCSRRRRRPGRSSRSPSAGGGHAGPCVLARSASRRSPPWSRRAARRPRAGAGPPRPPS